jgi:hypothetical protein
MTNAQTTQCFFASIDVKTKNTILQNIATTYAITQAEVLEEITHDAAEHLLDYLTGSIRTATSLTMKRLGFF